tara:strand:+ start:1348 stop:1488 length:141 start_codon:yes stop_codon:yes gene_type:complete
MNKKDILKICVKNRDKKKFIKNFNSYYEALRNATDRQQSKEKSYDK